jgi:bifunctional non-homologous end joining protein LigD
VSAPTRTEVVVDGREIALTNLDKVLYPATGLTKAAVIDYYARISPVLLPHLADRPLTVRRYPDGVGAAGFFMKNAPARRPGWVRTVTLPSPGSGMNRDTVDYLVVDDLPTLIWVANLAALELHTPMWRADAGADGGTADGAVDPVVDLVVADLDPGPPATVVDCCRVARLLRDAMAGDLVDGPLVVKTSGAKGLQVYGRAPEGARAAGIRDGMRRVAGRLARAHPDLVVANMRRDLRAGKVLVDWSQNSASKTTVSVYSPRAREHPTVSTPVSWDEVERARRPGDLVFTIAGALERVAEYGDLFKRAAFDVRK